MEKACNLGNEESLLTLAFLYLNGTDEMCDLVLQIIEYLNHKNDDEIISVYIGVLENEEKEIKIDRDLLKSIHYLKIGFFLFVIYNFY